MSKIKKLTNSKEFEFYQNYAKFVVPKLEKLESHGASNVDESVGLLDKIMGFFNKG